MEGLEKLEQVQRTIHLLHSVGISDANPDSERFLADFTFLLMQHCGELDITSKCELISKHMSKISSLFIDGALPFEAKGCSMVGNAAQLYPEPDLDPLDDAMVGMDSMMRSNSTLEDFISIKDATRAIHLKSFDYRIMNLLLYQLRGEKVNELHMEFLSVSELLVEVSDDLFDYEAKFITEAEEKYDGLLKALDPELSMKYQKRCEEATSEGGKTYGPSLGTWHIPPVIEDEARYRAAFSQA
ncbi:UNVERIFIED_CONTAM: hypothetical protein Sindi_0742400 [Sesamum indicum]